MHLENTVHYLHFMERVTAYCRFFNRASGSDVCMLCQFGLHTFGFVVDKTSLYMLYITVSVQYYRKLLNGYRKYSLYVICLFH
jgi:hypothetical protein